MSALRGARHYRALLCQTFHLPACCWLMQYCFHLKPKLSKINTKEVRQSHGRQELLLRTSSQFTWIKDMAMTLQIDFVQAGI